MKKIFKRFILALPLIVMMTLIFGFSGADGEASGSLSLKIAKGISEILNHIGISVSHKTLHIPIRKLAHMTEYGVLFVTAMWAFSWIKDKFRYILSYVFCVLYAVTDEIHQLFVPGRCGTYKDVLFDSAGAFCGLLLYIAVSHIFKRHIINKES